jgi:hypothetical protein
MENLRVLLAFLAVSLGCLLFAYLIAERPFSFSLVDRECEYAQQEYYHARDRAVQDKDKYPAADAEDGKHQREHADVCAQKLMAEAANRSYWLLGLTALFTFLTAVFAGKTVQVMQGTAKQQLRAYVLVDDTKLEEDGPRWLKGKVIFKNFGETPASNVVHWTGIGIRPYPLVEGLPPPTKGPAQHAAMGGGGSWTYRFDRQFTTEEWNAVLDGTAVRFHVYGLIKYRDIYGDGHEFPYSLYLHQTDSGEYVLVWRATNHDPDPA